MYTMMGAEKCISHPLGLIIFLTIALINVVPLDKSGIMITAPWQMYSCRTLREREWGYLREKQQRIEIDTYSTHVIMVATITFV